MKLSPTKDGRTDKNKIWDIRQRAFAFGVRIVQFCHVLEHHTGVSKNLIWQLIKSGTSIGANLEEGQAGQTKPDFITKNAIALKEARESNYWLRIILGSYDLDPAIAPEAEESQEESREISLIVGAIIVRARQ